MKLELGKGSKIIGTKKVSAKGQISGLKEYAGKEVMVILSTDEHPKAEAELPNEQLYRDVQQLVEEQMAKAFKEYKKLGDTFKSPNDAAREFIKKMQGDEFSKRVIKDLNKWLENIVPEAREDDEEKL